VRELLERGDPLRREQDRTALGIRDPQQVADSASVRGAARSLLVRLIPVLVVGVAVLAGSTQALARQTATNLAPRRQTIFHDAAHPSRIILPIIDAPAGL